MTFLLKGIFTKSTNDNIISLARSKWHKLRIKKFEGELVGIGIVAPDLTYRAIDDDYEECEEINNKIENELQDFSKIFQKLHLLTYLLIALEGIVSIQDLYAKMAKK
jgi:hypothetical protein